MTILLELARDPRGEPYLTALFTLIPSQLLSAVFSLISADTRGACHLTPRDVTSRGGVTVMSAHTLDGG